MSTGYRGGKNQGQGQVQGQGQQVPGQNQQQPQVPQTIQSPIQSSSPGPIPQHHQYASSPQAVAAAAAAGVFAPYGMYQPAYGYYGAPPVIPSQVGYFGAPSGSPSHISAVLDSPRTPGSGNTGSPSIAHGSPVPTRPQAVVKTHTPIKLSDPITHQPIDLSGRKPVNSPSPANLSGSASPRPVTVSPKPVVISTPVKSSGLDIQNQLKEQIRLKLQKEKEEKEGAERAEKERLDKERLEREEKEKVKREAEEKVKREAEEKVKREAAEAEEKRKAEAKAEAVKVEEVKSVAEADVDVDVAVKNEESVATTSTTIPSTTTATPDIIPETFVQQVNARVDSVNGRLEKRISGQIPSGPAASISQGTVPATPGSTTNPIATAQLIKATRPSAEEVQKFTYPSTIKAPACSSPNAFKYDIDFLLQFQPVVNFPPLENWDSIKAIMTFESSPGSSKSYGKGSFPRSGSLRNVNVGHNQQAMGSFGSGSNFRNMGDRNVSGSFGGPSMGHKGLNRMSSSSNLGASMGSKSGRQGSSKRRGGGDRQGSNRGGDYHHNNGPGTPGSTTPETPAQPAEKLVRSANAWVPKARTAKPAEEGKLTPEEVQRKVNSLLNKMTLENFDRISKQIMDVTAQSKEEKDGRTLRQVIELTFAKAVDESHWSKMYAQFCRQMTSSVDADIEDENVKDSKGNAVKGGALFRKYLLTRCQEEFERGWTDQLPTNPDGTPLDAELMSDEYYTMVAAKRRGLGLIRFIGELYMLELLSEKIIHACITKLCSQDDPSEDVIESLSQLMTTVGGQLERTTQLRTHFEYYFERMDFFRKKEGLPSRLRFMIMDVLDLRKSKWVNKRLDKGPKTLSEIHDEAARKQQADEAARQVRNSRSGRGLGGGSYRGDSLRSSNMMAGDLSKIGLIRSQSGNQTLGPSSMLNRDIGGSGSSRKSSSSAGLSLSKEGSRTPSQNTRANIFEHLNSDEESSREEKKNDEEEEESHPEPTEGETTTETTSTQD